MDFFWGGGWWWWWKVEVFLVIFLLFVFLAVALVGGRPNVGHQVAL